MNRIAEWFWRVTGESKIKRLADTNRAVLDEASIQIRRAEKSTKPDTHIKRSEELIKSASQGVNEMQKIRDNQAMASSFFTFIVFIVLMLCEVIFANNYGTKININLYIVIAQIVPIFLIALSVFTVKQTLTKKGYLALMIADVIPVIVGEFACLIAIGKNKSNSLLLTAALYAITSLFIQFCLKGYQYIGVSSLSFSKTNKEL